MSSADINPDSPRPQTGDAHIQQLLQDAVSHLQSGRLQEAESLYQQVLQRQPDHPIALHVLGLMHYHAGRAQRAVELLERAIAVKPDFAEACKNLANIYAELEQPDNAITRYAQAIAIAPSLFEAHYNLGVLLQRQNRLDDAKRHYQQALVFKPDLVEARDRLSEVLHLLAQAAAMNQEGVALRAEASVLQRQHQATELCNKAASCQALGKIDKAIAYYRQAIAAKPDVHEAHNNLGNLLVSKGQLMEALASYQSVIALQPGNFIGYSNVGMVLKLLNRFADAAASIREAIALEPNNAQLYNNLGLVLLKQTKLEEAAAMCERALQLQPTLIDAYFNLGNICTAQGRVKEGIDHRQHVLKLNPNHVRAETALLMDRHYLPDYSSADLFAAAKHWVEHYCPKERCLPSPANVPDPERRLRVGYVSGDFHNHPVGYFIEPVLAHHDKSRYEIFCYYNDDYNNGQGDGLTKRLQQSADHWRNISWLSDTEAARQIRRDGIDLLIDLSGYTDKNRLPAFAHKPAPVQATWMGYFDTTGLSAMDYIIADGRVIPPGEERYYVEKVVRLPDSYVCFSPPDTAINPSRLPAPAGENITFGCFHNPPKLTEAVIACWSRLLRALPNARLYLKYKAFGDAGVRKRFHDLFTKQGVEMERIMLSGYSPRHELLAAYREVDIGLDPFPYNGGTSTLEALWMGVPTISLRGDRFVSRVGDSILTTAGLGDLVADSEEDYIATAIGLAADLPRLAALRQELRPRLLASPLCDGPRFTRDLEAAYRRMWETWCHNERCPHA